MLGHDDAPVMEHTVSDSPVDSPRVDTAGPDPAADFAALEYEVLTNVNALESAVYSIRALIRLTEIGKTFRTMLGHWQALQQQVKNDEERLDQLRITTSGIELSQRATETEHAQKCQQLEEYYAARAEELSKQHDTWVQNYAEEEDRWQAWAQEQRAQIQAHIGELTREKEQIIADTALMRTALEEMRAKVVHIAGA